MVQLDALPARGDESPAAPPWRWSMSWWAWPLLLLALGGSVGGQLLSYGFIRFCFSECDAFALPPGERLAGQAATVAMVAVVALASWMTAYATRNRAVATAAVLSTLFGVALVADSLTTDAWAHGWCF
jgi:hypothetical protein